MDWFAAGVAHGSAKALRDLDDAWTEKWNSLVDRFNELQVKAEHLTAELESAREMLRKWERYGKDSQDAIAKRNLLITLICRSIGLHTEEILTALRARSGLSSILEAKPCTNKLHSDDPLYWTILNDIMSGARETDGSNVDAEELLLLLDRIIHSQPDY